MRKRKSTEIGSAEGRKGSKNGEAWQQRQALPSNSEIRTARTTPTNVGSPAILPHSLYSFGPPAEYGHGRMARFSCLMRLAALKDTDTQSITEYAPLPTSYGGTRITEIGRNQMGRHGYPCSAHSLLVQGPHLRRMTVWFASSTRTHCLWS